LLRNIFEDEGRGAQGEPGDYLGHADPALSAFMLSEDGDSRLAKLRRSRSIPQGGRPMTYSYTQISQYLGCHRRYRHRYLDGWLEKDTCAAVLFRRAFEQALAALFRCASHMIFSQPCQGQIDLP
jgi:hypothetical protein